MIKLLNNLLNELVHVKQILIKMIFRKISTKNSKKGDLNRIYFSVYPCYNVVNSKKYHFWRNKK